MSEKVLFVDDDPKLLSAVERQFRKQFQLDTATGAEAGLAKLGTHGPYAVVVSDRQMPGMDGVQFLANVRQSAPETIRIMLTGNADLESTVQVVNEGNIFRFLTKPCAPEHLAKVLEDALAQYRLVTAEKELLSKTLNGSIKLLTDILSMVESQSFGQAQQLRDTITIVTDKLRLNNAWEIHLATMLAPIGYVTVPPETLLRSRSGQVLSKQEEQILSRVPETAARLLANIPRLEGVARIVRYQQKCFNGSGIPADSVSGEAIPAGARLLKILFDMTQLQGSGMSRIGALDEMQERQGWYDPALLASIRSAFGGKTVESAEAHPVISLDIDKLMVGMVLHSSVETRDGTLILSAGHQLTEMTLEKILNFENISGIKQPVFVKAAQSA